MSFTAEIDSDQRSRFTVTKMPPPPKGPYAKAPTPTWIRKLYAWGGFPQVTK
jgi:hypothetical protein